MTEASKHPPKRRSLVTKFNLSLIFLYLCTITLTAPGVYYFTRQEVHRRAEAELRLMVDVVKSIQDYVATDLRPYLMQEGIYYSPAFSGIVATARIAGYLEQKQPHFYIKNASDNPLNQANLLQGMEHDLLERFRNHRDLQSLSRIGVIEGQRYLVNSAPKISKPGCLRCHGEPAAAPVDVRSTYGETSGYGYEPDQVVGVSLVGVPLEDVQSLAVERSLILIGGITLLFGVLFVLLNLLVRRLILMPVVEITEVATAVSKGDIQRSLEASGRNDEIAELSNAFELMRRSLWTAIKRMKRQS